MKTNKLVISLLILYFSLFGVLLTALYLMMPFTFEDYLLVSLSNIFIPTAMFIISSIIILLNSLKKTNKACDRTYFICKKIPITLYFLNMILSCIVAMIFKTKTAQVVSLITIFAQSVFYIYSISFYKKILENSEKELRPKTTSITKAEKYTRDIPESINLVFKLVPLLVFNILISIYLTPLNINSIVYIAALVIISILSIINISYEYYNNINKMTKEFSVADFINYDNEFSDLAFKINSTKYIYNDYIYKLQNEKTEELEKERLASIEMIRRTVDAKDTYTRGHSDRVSSYSVLIGERLGLSKEDLSLLKVGGLFHDIGKIGIPDNILLKEGKLTDDEFNEIKKHPSIGAHILENSSVFERIVPIVLHHHEKFDGRGYPDGLKGNDIPYLARIVAVADTFDAMTSKRSYRDPLPLGVVKAEFEKFSGTQFDPDIAKVFLDILNNEYYKIEEIMSL